VAEHTGGSNLGYTGANEAGSVRSGIMSRRKSMVTYVWALPSPNSSNVAATNSPSFEVNFAAIAGVVADDYEVSLVKLPRTQSNCRLVGAL
jgi:hypothetical protein